jgi:hypothetical protein
MHRESHSQFPSTHATWIVESLANGERGLQLAQLHVMERYRDALIAYATALPARAVAEPAELVSGFFTRRVATEGFLTAWRASGLSLRRFLMNGLSLDARTVLRSERREAERRRRFATEEAAEARERARREADAEAAFEGAWARAVVGEACERVRAELVAAGDAKAWETFEAHVLRGEPYARIAAARGMAGTAGEETRMVEELMAEKLAVEKLAVEVRRVGRRMRAALRDTLAEEGIAPGEVERELRVVLARLRA